VVPSNSRDEFWKLAADVCTPKQLRVLELKEKHGASIYQIGYMTDLHPSTVRGHLRAAARNIRRALAADQALV
jgi:DNA-binding CsgD family transcriptional regulator